MEYSCQKAVLLIFFNRPDTFKQVFEQVRRAKPKYLILAQDGPRNEKDKIGIEKCREIAESVDWECEVIKDYSEENLGCGVRPMSAISNALKRFEDVIILEDDCVPADSFFPYCEELLDRYKDDQRICYISGLNHFEEWDCGEDSYFFTKTGAIWGWATWRRAWSNFYDYYVEGSANSRDLRLVSTQFIDKYAFKSRVGSWEKAYASKKSGEKLSYWDAQWGFVKYSQSMLVTVPKKNLIRNIGAGEGSTHAQNVKVDDSKKGKNFMYIPTHSLEFPLREPKICVCDIDYDNKVYKRSKGNPIRRNLAKIVKKILGRS